MSGSELIGLAALLVGLIAQGLVIAGIVARSLSGLRTYFLQELKDIGGALERHRDSDREEFRLIRTEMSTKTHDLAGKIQSYDVDNERRLDALVKGVITREEFSTAVAMLQRQNDAISSSIGQLNGRFDAVMTAVKNGAKHV